MDAHDIFSKLTKGVHFTRKNLPKKASVFVGQAQQGTEENVASTQEIIKSECEEDEESNDFKILSDFVEVKGKRKKTKDINPDTKRRKLEEEELNRFRNTYKINVLGKNVPAPIKTFEELEINYNVPAKLLDTLANCGYPLPTPIQMQAIPVMLQGRPLMACAPTGSGKTVAFLTPLIKDLKTPQKKGFRAIILCPTRELAKQTLRECLRLTENTGLKTHIISKVSQIEQKFGPKSNKKYDILVSTPNRVRYLLGQEPALLDLSNIEWVVIDEADKLMEDGQNSFKEQLDDILNACTNPNKKLALFSATYTVPVAKWALKNLKGLIRVTIGVQNAATDLVQQELLFVGSESGKLLAFRDLVRSGLQPPVLIFVQTKDRAKQLFEELIYDGINVDVIHADRTQQQRDNVVRAFREGKIWVLICTELMGRGIDFKGVNLVVNYDFPPSSISYIHRIGRTGRAGRPGKAITYYTEDDKVNLRSIAQIIRNSGGTVPEFMLSLKKPKKSDKKKLEKRAPQREDITTLPKFILERRKKLKEKEFNKSNVKKMEDSSNEGSKNRSYKKVEKNINRKVKNRKK